MDETGNIALPLLQPSQAQKHVTVNEALILLDASAQLVLESRSMAAPPANAMEGMVYAVPEGATGEWSQAGGQLAVWSNGSWVFLVPGEGWRGWDIQTETAITLRDGEWQDEGLSRGPSGASAIFRTVEAEHVIQPGAQNTTSIQIPEKVTLFAVSARVLDSITGSASSWRLGHAGATDRFGSGLGQSAGSFAEGLLGQPQAYYSAEPLIIGGEGGNLAGGRVRLALHYVEYSLPGV